MIKNINQKNSILENRYIMVLDTETVNSFAYPLVYDLGFIIYDTKNKKIVKSYNRLVSEFFNKKQLMESAYYSEKLPLYYNMIEFEKLTVINWGYIIRHIYQQIVKYNIQAIYAYNANFDKRAIESTCLFLDKDNLLENIPFIDIMGNIAEMVDSSQYKNWAETTGHITDSKRYYSTTAETIYRYITNQGDFIEDHTALSDCYIELEILNHMIENYNQEYNKSYKPKKFIGRGLELERMQIISPNGKKQIIYYSDIEWSGNTIQFNIED